MVEDPTTHPIATCARCTKPCKVRESLEGMVEGLISVDDLVSGKAWVFDGKVQKKDQILELEGRPGMPLSNQQKHKWIDSSSYSRGEERIPKSWTVYFEGFRLSVFAHRDYEGEYVSHSFGDLELPNRSTGTKDPVKARQLALKRVHAAIAKLSKEASIEIKEPSK